MKSKVLLLFLMKCRYHIKSLMSDQQTDLLVCYYASCNNLAQLFFLYIYSYIVAGSFLDLPARVTTQHKSNLYIPVAINAAFFLFCVIVANIIEVETTCWRIQSRTLRMVTPWLSRLRWLYNTTIIIIHTHCTCIIYTTKSS